MAFPKQRLAVFIDGCFWHGCPLHYVRPRSRADFWSSKLTENIDRDRRQSMALQSAGWHVMRLWEHEVVRDLMRAAEQVQFALQRDVVPWTMQRRVRRVLELDGGIERREFVVLGAPEAVIGFADGARITAKARMLKDAAGRSRTNRRGIRDFGC